MTADPWDSAVSALSRHKAEAVADDLLTRCEWRDSPAAQTMVGLMAAFIELADPDDEQVCQTAKDLFHVYIESCEHVIAAELAFLTKMAPRADLPASVILSASLGDALAGVMRKVVYHGIMDEFSTQSAT